MKPYVTLTDLVEIVSEFTKSETELIATVVHLIKSGQVNLKAPALPPVQVSVPPVPAHAVA